MHKLKNPKQVYSSAAGAMITLRPHGAFVKAEVPCAVADDVYMPRQSFEDATLREEVGRALVIATAPER